MTGGGGSPSAAGCRPPGRRRHATARALPARSDGSAPVPIARRSSALRAIIGRPIAPRPPARAVALRLAAAVSRPLHGAHHQLVPADVVERHGGERRAVDVQAQRVLVRFVGHVMDVPGSELDVGTRPELVVEERKASGVVPTRHRLDERSTDHAHGPDRTAVVVEVHLATARPGNEPRVEVGRPGHEPPGAFLHVERPRPVDGRHQAARHLSGIHSGRAPRGAARPRSGVGCHRAGGRMRRG